MTWQLWFQFAAFTVVIICGLMTAHWSRQAAAYNRITGKLRSGDPLTARERKLMDKVRL